MEQKPGPDKEVQPETRPAGRISGPEHNKTRWNLKPEYSRLDLLEPPQTGDPRLRRFKLKKKTEMIPTR